MSNNEYTVNGQSFDTNTFSSLDSNFDWSILSDESLLDVATQNSDANIFSTAIGQNSVSTVQQIDDYNQTTQQSYGYLNPLTSEDRRASLTLAPNFGQFDTSGIFDILTGNLKGFIFPYTPSISVSGRVNYDTQSITHSNMSLSYYKNTDPLEYGLSGKFTTSTPENALNMLASIIFLNHTSKSSFGELNRNGSNNGVLSGTPPPIVYFNAYNNLINNVPCVITSFKYDLKDDVDYVKMVFDNGGSKITDSIYANLADLERLSGISISSVSSDQFIFWLPIIMTINVGLKVQPNIKKVQKEFSVEKLKKGELYKNNSNSGYSSSGWTW